MKLSMRAGLAMFLFICAAGLLHPGTPPTAVSPVRVADVAPAPYAARVALTSYVPRALPGPRAKVLRLRLASAPFPDPQRRDGFRYGDTDYPAIPHYVDPSVAVLVPPGFTPCGPVNLVFFFHGWNTSIDDAQRKFDLYRQFIESRVQALLVLPELAWNAPDSYGGKLERTGGFARLVQELLRRLRADGRIPVERVGSIVLAGHSGAYRVIAEILGHGGLAADIREVWLFDALYAFTGRFSAWIRQDRGRFVSVSATDGEQTTDVDGLIASLEAKGVPFQLAPDDMDAGAAALRSRVVFLRSDSDHYGVVGDRDEFRRLLETSPVLAAPRWPG